MAMEEQVDLGPTWETIIKQLTWEGLNAPTHHEIVAVCNEDIHKWVIDTHDLEHQAGPIAAFTASLNALLASKDNDREKSSPAAPPDHSCWGCGQSGHLHRNCPKARTKTKFPKCQKGFHLACDCRSFSQIPLNSRRGIPQPSK